MATERVYIDTDKTPGWPITSAPWVIVQVEGEVSLDQIHAHLRSLGLSPMTEADYRAKCPPVMGVVTMMRVVEKRDG